MSYNVVVSMEEKKIPCLAAKGTVSKGAGES